MTIYTIAKDEGRCTGKLPPSIHSASNGWADIVQRGINPTLIRWLACSTSFHQERLSTCDYQLLPRMMQVRHAVHAYSSCRLLLYTRSAQRELHLAQLLVKHMKAAMGICTGQIHCQQTHNEGAPQILPPHTCSFGLDDPPLTHLLRSVCYRLRLQIASTHSTICGAHGLLQGQK